LNSFQLFIEAVTQSRLNLKTKNAKTYTGYLSLAFSFTIGLNNKKRLG